MKIETQLRNALRKLLESTPEDPEYATDDDWNRYYRTEDEARKLAYPPKPKEYHDGSK